MRYCLSATQSKDYLKKADEILLNWQNRDSIIDIIDINPNATIILFMEEVPALLEEDWEKIKQDYIMTRNNLKLLFYGPFQTENIVKAVENQIPFFFIYAASNPYDANALVNLGVSDIYITGRLAHQLDYVDTLPVQIRVIPQHAQAPFGYKPLLGAWFRPEDIENLKMIDVCDFGFEENKRRVQALYRIYAEEHEWPGELYMLVPEIEDKEIMNRMLPPDFQEKRSNCRMRCQEGGYCHICENYAYLAHSDLLKGINNAVKGNI